MIVGYCRISTLEPAARLELQRRDLAEIGAHEFFCEKASIFGKAPELERAIEFAQKGDVIAITKPYRIARSSRGVLALIARLGRKGVGLRILDTPVDTSTTTGRMILGSVPLWSLGVSPLRSVLWDLGFGCLRQGIYRLGKRPEPKAAGSSPDAWSRRSVLSAQSISDITRTVTNEELPQNAAPNVWAGAEGLAPAATALATTPNAAIPRFEPRPFRETASALGARSYYCGTAGSRGSGE